MSKFRVGDLITGKLEAPYNITNKDSICEILFIRGNFHGDILVRLVSHKDYDYREELGEEFLVSSCYFNLYKEANNFRRNKCTNSK